jgi:hypothetical protein
MRSPTGVAGLMTVIGALAGYVDGRHGEVIALALPLKGLLCSMEPAWQVQDAAAGALTGGERWDGSWPH